MKTILSLLLISSFAYCVDCPKDYEKLVTLHGGRVKSLMMTARSSIKELTGKYSYQNKSALEIFCQLNFSDNESEFIIPIEHVELKQFLNVDKSQIDINKAIERREEIKIQIIKQKEKTSYKKALNKLWLRMDKYLKLKNGEAWFVPDSDGFKSFRTLYLDKDPASISKDLEQRQKIYLSSNSDTYLLENMLIKQKVFSFAMLLAILSIFTLVLIKKSTLGLSLTILTVLTQVYGLTLRVIISGRAPITNMYETVLFSGLGGLIIALIIYSFKKDKIYLLAGLGYNILCLFMMKFSAGMLNEDISPLVPVLRDNFWLSTHVTTIILSYAALALSWSLANIVLFKQRFSSITKKDYRYYEGLIYTSIKAGIVMLSAGIILGGIWADYSWGRFWGWDPKETWSLIVLLFYMALLHGKGTTWVTPHKFIVASAFGFLTVMMAWFGVNYILASGLHSYGFSEGGAIFLGSFFLVQIVFLIITGKNKTVK